MLENQTVSYVLPIQDFAAVDADLKGQLVYRVVGDGLAPVFFTLNEDDKPAVKNPLIYAPDNEYKVGSFRMQLFISRNKKWKNLELFIFILCSTMSLCLGRRGWQKLVSFILII